MALDVSEDVRKYVGSYMLQHLKMLSLRVDKILRDINSIPRHNTVR